MPIYNKLVRDKIPQVIVKTGKSFETRILPEDEYRSEVHKKMNEELQEYFEATDDSEAVEELADLLELNHAASRIHGSSVEELESVRAAKAEKRGAFQEGIFLIEVEDE